MTKILTAHQPAYLPWLGLFHKIALSDVYVFMDDVKYSNSDKFINRNYIKKSSNEKHRLTVPILTAGSDNIIIKDLKIDYGQNWQRSHFLTIKQYYSKSKFGKEYFKFFEELYSKKYDYFVDFTYEMLSIFLNLLDIKTKVVKSSELNITSEKNQYLIDLCKKFDCKIYIFGQEGENYVDKPLWKDQGLIFYIQRYNHPTYLQLFDSFIPCLSVIDLLFNHGTKSKEIIMQGNINKEQIRKEVIV